MALTILNRPGFAEVLGSNVGSGLSQGLSMLAQQRLQNMMQNQQRMGTAMGLQAAGFSPERAQGLSLLDPTLQRELLKQGMAAENQQGLAALSSALFGGGNQQSTSDPNAQGDIAQNPINLISQALAQGQINPRQAETLMGQVLEQQREQQKLAMKERELSLKTRKDMRDDFKETEKVRESISTKAESAREELASLKRLNELNTSGNVRAGFTEDLLDRFGLNFESLKNADTSEFQKLSVGFLRNLKGIFGGRITNIEVENYLKSIPNLMQNAQGRAAVIRNMALASQGALVKQQIMEQIAQENNGSYPFDLQEQVNKSARPVLDALADQLVQGLGKKVQKNDAFPNPTQNNGARIRDTKTGIEYISNGIIWEPVIA